MAISQWQRYYLVSQWLAQYGQFVAGMSYTMSIKLLSIYTVGSLLCVLLPLHSFVIPFAHTTLLMLYTFISFIALFTVCLHPTFYVVIIFAFVIGFTSAGGVVQIGLTLMAERFPYAKGKATGIYLQCGQYCDLYYSVDYGSSVPKKVLPILCGSIPPSLPSVFTGTVIGLRSRKKTRHHSLKENVAPGG